MSDIIMAKVRIVTHHLDFKEVTSATMANFYSFFLAFLFTISLVSGEVVQSYPCNDETTDCEIHEVRVEPCAEAAKNQACKIKRGNAAKVSFDFTPGFSATTATSEAYWTQQLKDIPWKGMNTDACSSTTCPIQQGVKQTYTYSLELSKKYPTNSYDVKWKLWNAENKMCCFIVPIKIVR